MKWVRVKSRMLAAVAYNGDWHHLYLEFRSGDIYCYRGVPVERYEELLAADSKGQYCRHHILHRFPYERIPRTFRTAWPAFTSEWNKGNANRESKGRIKPHKKTFDTIAALPTPKDLIPVGTASADAIAKLVLGLQFFTQRYGRCMMLSFSYGQVLTDGHAIAIERLSDSTFRMFDPNYGVYEFSSDAKLGTAVGFLLQRLIQRWAPTQLRFN